MPASPVTLNLEADMAAVKPDTTTPSTTDGKKTASKGMRPEPYRVANVEKIASPDGLSGGTWYRYILDNGSSVITGQTVSSTNQSPSPARSLRRPRNQPSSSTNRSTPIDAAEAQE